MILNLGNKNKIGSSTISQFNYTNDELGRRIKRVDTTSGVSSTNLFDYNQRSEVTSALMSTNTYAYNYDDIGNRVDLTTNLSNQTNTCAYVVNELNQYTNINCSVGSTTQSPVYDNDGNMLTYNNWTFTWNAENRLIVASNSTTVVTYAYDYQGRRFMKTIAENGSLIKDLRFVYDGYKLIQRSEFLSGNIDQFVWSGEQVLLLNDGSNSYYYASDANKNVRDLVDASGNSVAHYEYSPFGQITTSTGSLKTKNPFRFSSEYFDSETGFVYYNFRYYSSELGRWLSRDLIEENGGVNLYVFVGNDGIGKWDEWGTSPNNCEATNKNGLKKAIDKYIKEHPGLTPNQLIDRMANDMKAGDYTLSGVRYFNTNDGTTIDVLHFAATADYGQWAFGGEVTGNVLGWFNELGQAIRGDESGHPFGGNEDLASNAAGADFGDEYLNDKKSLSDQILEYFDKNYGGITDEVPDYSKDKEKCECKKSGSEK